MKWNNINEIAIPESGYPIEVKNENGTIYFAFYHNFGYCRGIAKLEKTENGYNWDGKTFLLKVTHWREIE